MKIDLSNNNRIRNPYFGIGMEKLDRDAFDPKLIYDHVAALGVKWVRIQSGWTKTEKKRGQYDFLWLDEIVEGLVSRNLTPWICLCYGNPLYDERAKKIAGGLDCPPLSAEAKEAWIRYCQKLGARYRGKVAYYEVWNEPEWLWGGKADPTSYTLFCRETARAIKEADPDGKIIVGSVAFIDPKYMTACIEKGVLDYADAISYHAYTYDERTFSCLNSFYRQVCNERKKGIEVIHGECGSQSQKGGNGAFKGFPTDPKKQAKQLLRQMVTDRLSGAFFSSYFTATDMHENLMAKAGKPIKKHGYFGVLKASFDENGIACAPFVPKLSYYALQNICAFFDEKTEMTSFPFWIDKERDDNSPGLFRLCKKAFSKRIGSFWQDDRLEKLTTVCLRKGETKAFVYWESTDLLNRNGFSSTMDIRFCCPGTPKSVDLLTGNISDIPFERKDGCVWIKSLPVRDYPLAVIFGEFVKEI